MTESSTPAPAPLYPVSFDVEEQITDRNRLTVALRAILAIPHALLVGTPGVGLVGLGTGWLLRGLGSFSFAFGGNVIGAAAYVMAIVSWFAIVFTSRQPRGLWDFSHFYMRWHTKALTYMALLRDEYPPFGDGDYPAQFSPGEFPESRRRWTVALRFIYVIPHALVLFALGVAWTVTVIISWFAILFTGGYPTGLYRFGVGYLRWSFRVEVYMLLMTDEYPPFSLE